MIHAAVTIFKDASEQEYYEYGNIEGRFQMALNDFVEKFGNVERPTSDSACLTESLANLSPETLKMLRDASMSNRLRYMFKIAEDIRETRDENVRREFLYPAVVQIVVWR